MTSREMRSRRESAACAADLVTRADAVMQTGESEHYRAYCYFPVAANRNFELFYIELDAGTSNMSIGHPPRAGVCLCDERARYDKNAVQDNFCVYPGERKFARRLYRRRCGRVLNKKLKVQLRDNRAALFLYNVRLFIYPSSTGA